MGLWFSSLYASYKKRAVFATAFALYLLPKLYRALRKRNPKHLALDTFLLAAVGFTVSQFVPNGLAGVDFGLSGFPNHYTPVFDFIKSPMDPSLALVIWMAGIYFLFKAYVLEGNAVAEAHKKYRAHGTRLAAIVHGTGSVLELTLGFLAVLSLADTKIAPGAATARSAMLNNVCRALKPYAKTLCQANALLCLLVNVPSGLILNPGVFGIKHLTVAGFLKFAFLRLIEVARIFYVDYRWMPNLWILLQVGTVVRLLGYFVLPYTSNRRMVRGEVKEGRRGDLFTEPTIYSFNILLSGFLTAGFVYPPKYLLGSLGVYALAQYAYPVRMSLRRAMLDEDDEYEDKANGNKNGVVAR